MQVPTFKILSGFYLQHLDALQTDPIVTNFRSVASQIPVLFFVVNSEDVFQSSFKLGK